MTLDTKETDHLYKISKLLGRGTFGDVYKAEVVETPGAVVALKHLRDSRRVGDPERLREVSFFRAVPPHAKLVALYDMFFDARSGNVMFALEYMQGNLLQVINHTRQAGGCLPTLTVAALVGDMLQGLQHIHSHSFVHRDIKPENVLVKGRDHSLEVKLADFGLSRPLTSGTVWTGYVATRWYRAPEQLLELPVHDTGVDIWAVAVIMCELCNLRPVFPGDTTSHMILMQLTALGVPSTTALGGEAPVIAREIRNLSDKQLRVHRDEVDGKQPMRGWFRFGAHEIFTKLAQAGLQWDHRRRPSALNMLLMLRHILCFLNKSPHGRYELLTAPGIMKA